ncbi:MAG: S-adenosylmethionine:tRNA ribosyltransferase-isomerase, partial [Bacteroidales bacterium]|nr:S-adenosylmethionine:tRNA ribosyltransferase-isomerase [Bacteroidales bacterium]
PLPDREQSRLLFYDRGKLKQHIFNELPDLLPGNSMLVFNNTRVIQARLEFRKSTGARIEIFCLEPVDPLDYQRAFEATDSCRWKCMVGNAKKWKDGIVSLISRIGEQEIILEARHEGRYGDSYIIEFRWNNGTCSFGEIIEHAGSTPIPPYLNREAEASDKERYQTIYSRPPGSVAAPTAGLHFTDKMLVQLDSQGITTAELTLHVGAGTFVPVKSGNARHHRMHSEKVSVSLKFLEHWMDHPGELIAVGTTTTRSLESLYWLGVRLCTGASMIPENIHLAQWENEHQPDKIALRESQAALLEFCRRQELDPLQFSTQLMIVPGYSFRTIDGLVTNFHLPGSTLLLLIAALIEDDWKNLYEFAIENRFRFLSYGDSSLLLRKRATI